MNDCRDCSSADIFCKGENVAYIFFFIFLNLCIFIHVSPWTEDASNSYPCY